MRKYFSFENAPETKISTAPAVTMLKISAFPAVTAFRSKFACKGGMTQGNFELIREKLGICHGFVPFLFV
jgi:hypothetical protein